MTTKTQINAIDALLLKADKTSATMFGIVKEAARLAFAEPAEFPAEATTANAKALYRVKQHAACLSQLADKKIKEIFTSQLVLMYAPQEMPLELSAKEEKDGTISRRLVMPTADLSKADLQVAATRVREAEGTGRAKKVTPAGVKPTEVSAVLDPNAPHLAWLEAHVGTLDGLKMINRILASHNLILVAKE